jgi:dTDP-4-amino-4,6-dideoxy-D-galactose acyltransferase
MPGADAPPAELLPWDSEFFGRTIGRVTEETLTSESLRAIDAWAAEHAVDCLYFLARADDAVAIRSAEDGGFRLVEIRVELRRPRTPFKFDSVPPPAEAVTVRSPRPDDLPELRRIAAHSYLDSRFYVDPNFPDERAGEMYAMWVERSLAGDHESTVFVAEAEGRVAGFTTLRPERAAAHVVLIAVDPELMRGTLAPRVSHALGIAILRWADERRLGLRAVTQGRNVRTQRFIEGYGLRVHSISLYFHKWYR